MNRHSEYVPSESYWFEEVPSHWEKTRNKFIFYSEKSTVGNKWNEFDLLTMGKEGVRLRDISEGGKFPESFESYQIVKPNQLIFCLFDMDETPRTVGFSNLRGMITSAYDVFSCKNNVNPKFVNYFYQSIDDFKGLRPYYTGLRKVVRPDTFMGITIYIPPINEQNWISNYLDKKTSQIDSLVEKISHKIELLKEQRTSLINQCVTKGLNPDVGMKDSGVEWIGEIPVSWDVKKIKHGFYVKGRIGWKGLKSSEFLSEGFSYLVTGTDFRDGKVDWKGCYHIDKDRYEEDPYIQLHENDLLITKDGSIGKLAIVDELDKPACLNSGIFVVRSINKDFTTRYFYWVLMSNIFTQFNGYTSYGSTIQHLYQNIFVEFSFSFPTMEEQILISNYLDKKTSQIESLIEKEGKRIELLKEYRQSLISNFVTGKMRITEEMI